MTLLCHVDVPYVNIKHLISMDKEKYRLNIDGVVRRSTYSYREGNGCSHYRMLHGILSMLEPYEVKVSRTVLRGLGAGNSPRLPDVHRAVAG